MCSSRPALLRRKGVGKFTLRAVRLMAVSGDRHINVAHRQICNKFVTKINVVGSRNVMEQGHRCSSDPDALSLKTVCMLAIQLINRVEALHGKGIVHRSIQPDHIVVDVNTNVVYLISFSRAKWLGDGISTERSPYNMGQPLQATENLKENETTSTSPYASVKAHDGVYQLPLGDLESLGYVLYRLYESPPWESRNKEDMITAKKYSLQNLWTTYGLENISAI
ncbi:hypothetical protein GP486_001932 [Trichoglossum hirsutum]|uniref:Protein kinase domain-containing protein n=1 Tax=Trichoglossum hirsutum TaxID=265104 RepID=A0A9P8RS83_9PEZI|nr:hypothetical protein GP486_001932 [Trichoglossum hirsutum]